MKEVVSIDTILSVKKSSESTYKELYGLYQVPQTGGEPQKVEVSNLRDKKQRFVNGVEQMESLTFNGYKTSEADTETVINSNFDYLYEAMEAGTVLDWKLEYPDGSYYTWSGRPNVYHDSLGVNDVLKFTLTIGQETKLVYCPVSKASE